MDEDTEACLGLSCTMLFVVGVIGGIYWFTTSSGSDSDNDSSAVEQIVNVAEAANPNTIQTTSVADVVEQEPDPYKMIGDIKVYKEKQILPSVKLLGYTNAQLLLEHSRNDASYSYDFYLTTFQTPNGVISLATKKPLALAIGQTYDVKYTALAEDYDLTTKDFYAIIPKISGNQIVRLNQEIDDNVVGIIESIEQVISYKSELGVK